MLPCLHLLTCGTAHVTIVVWLLLLQGGFAFDNHWVVPYNPYLSMLFNCHINVEVCTSIATLLWVKWEDETPTPKVRDLESSGTPECLELNSKAQNTLH